MRDFTESVYDILGAEGESTPILLKLFGIAGPVLLEVIDGFPNVPINGLLIFRITKKAVHMSISMGCINRAISILLSVAASL